MSLKPLIAIVGTTGVGKSRLAVDLALHCTQSGHLPYPKARVINGDAMQVYNGLNILTNKMPSEEQRGVKHCLMDFRAPGEQYLVTDWVKDASTCIEEAHREGELPIVVGGTSYWIQNLIFARRLASLPPEPVTDRDYDPELLKRLASLPTELRDIWLNLPSKAPHPDDSPEEAYRLHSLLSALDSATACRWHWRDSRRVLTSLRVIKEQKRTVGSVHAEQIPQSRYKTLVIWLYSDANLLHPRLDARVDEMLKKGLLEEVRELQSIAEKGGGDKDYTTGIYQSIGYPEFEGFLASHPSESVEASRADFEAATERMKISTRQYARRQVQWLRNKLLPVVKDAQDVQMFVIPVTDGGTWDLEVREKAQILMEEFLLSKPLMEQDLTAIPGLDRLSEKPSTPKTKLICPICTRDGEKPIMIEEGKQWDLHTRTRHHRKAARKRKQNEARETSDRQNEGLVTTGLQSDG